MLSILKPFDRKLPFCLIASETTTNFAALFYLIKQMNTSQFCMSIRLIYMSQTVHYLLYVDQIEIHVESLRPRNAKMLSCNFWHIETKTLFFLFGTKETKELESNSAPVADFLMLMSKQFKHVLKLIVTWNFN